MILACHSSVQMFKVLTTWRQNRPTDLQTHIISKKINGVLTDITVLLQRCHKQLYQFGIAL